MREFDTIYLSWRQGQGSRRYIVGVIKEAAEKKYAFRYVKEEVEKAIAAGFSPYTEFPDVHQEYHSNVVDIFAQRLIKSVRPDIQSFYEFWEVDRDKLEDKFYLLGHTQGLMPTDNFEFLADYKPVTGLHFLTDLAGLSQVPIKPEEVSQGDKLSFELEPDNEYDKEAVFVKKGEKKLGYIKKIHCKIFHKPDAEKLQLEVKALEKNGVVKRIFVKVFM
ncbi:MAG TPA: hypothetical protein PL009_05300 [Flavipsychrobacter sp.]|nr:hypothetical protein [Flavipsychrobacter sp.]